MHVLRCFLDVDVDVVVVVVRGMILRSPPVAIVLKVAAGWNMCLPSRYHAGLLASCCGWHLGPYHTRT